MTLTAEEYGASLVEHLLPLADKLIENEQLKRIDTFKAMIMAADEDGEFFTSPTAYFRHRNMLSLHAIPLPNGDVIPVIDDVQTIKCIRDLRARRASGESLSFDNWTPAVLVVRDANVYDYTTMWTRTDYFTVTKGRDVQSDSPNFGSLISSDIYARLVAAKPSRTK